MISGTYETNVGAFFCLKGSRNGHNLNPSLFKLSVIVIKFFEDRGTFSPAADSQKSGMVFINSDRSAENLSKNYSDKCQFKSRRVLCH